MIYEQRTTYHAYSHAIHIGKIFSLYVYYTIYALRLQT